MLGTREPAGDLGRPVEAGAFHDPVAGEHLLGLGVRTVGDERHAVLSAETSGVHRRREGPGLDELASLGQFGVEGPHESGHCREVLGRPGRQLGGLTGHSVVVLLRGVRQDHVFHVPLLSGSTSLVPLRETSKLGAYPDIHPCRRG